MPDVEACETLQSCFYASFKFLLVGICQVKVRLLGGTDVGRCILLRRTAVQIETCWDLVYQRSDFDNRLKAVQEFNAGSRYRKRGLALIPTKFGISFTAKFLNQVQPCPQVCDTVSSPLREHPLRE